MTTQGKAGKASRGEASLGTAGQGKAGGARRGTARPDVAGQGKAGAARRGAARLGRAVQGSYTYREGARVSGVPAEVVGAELERLRRAGSLTSSAVVDAARDPDAPLHPAFTWDDEVAGEKWRLVQARLLIRAVVVTSGDGRPRNLYVHISRTDEAEGEYRTLDTIISHPDAYVLALAEAQRRLASAQQAIDDLRHAAEGVKPGDLMARIALAAQALSTAEQAVRTLH